MLQRQAIIEILNRAHAIDTQYELFGAKRHCYQLNPPVAAAFVRETEARYGFTLPEDYFRFITEVGDGGAGPDYGIEPFASFLRKGHDRAARRFYDDYRRSLSQPFTPRSMRPDEVEEYAIVSREVYDQHPGRYFVYIRDEEENEEETVDDNWCDTDGFLILGTHGCQWDFGLVTTGPLRDKVFDFDNEGGYGLVADSFTAFYQGWLDTIADVQYVRQERDKWHAILNR